MATEFHPETVDDVAVLTITGRVAVEHLDELEDQLEELSTRTGRSAVVDLSGCPFLASRVFPTLLAAFMEMDRAGKQLLITCNQGLLEILQVLRLDRVLVLYTDRFACLKDAAVLQQG